MFISPKKLPVLAAALLVAALLSAPAPASAGGVKIDLRLHGGLSYVSAADVNAGSAGFFDYVQYMADLNGASTQGGYGALHAGYDLGGDIVFMLSPRFGIGVGAGYLKNSKTSLLSETFEGQEGSLEGGPSLSAIPIRLGIFYTMPLGKKLSLTANAGAAYYASLKFNYHLRLSDPAGWLDETIDGSRSSVSDNLGVQGGLGLEYAMSPKMGFFCELLGRYASFKNFETVTAAIAWSDGASDSFSGKLYLTDESIDGTTFTMFQVSDGTPDGTYREPKFDLSGFCLQAGIRIRI